jgi:holo-[acyl-carrier protein] synthase
MDVVGIGTQVMECVRVRRLIDRHGDVFLRQVYTPRETAFCNGKAHSTEHFTAIWAAKEAVFRSLGTTWRRGMAWTDIEVICENGGTPQIAVTGATAELMATRGVGAFLLTMAHCRTFATATGLAVRGSPANAPA